MSLHPEPIGEVPAETMRVARAAFPKGTMVTRLRDEFCALYQDEDFRKFYPRGCYEPVASRAACFNMRQTKATRWKPASVLAYRS